MTAKYVRKTLILSVYVLCRSISLFARTLSRCRLFILLLLVHDYLSDRNQYQKDITFVQMSIPVTFSRLCKRISVSGQTSGEREREGSFFLWLDRFLFSHLTYIDVSIAFWFVLVGKRTTTQTKTEPKRIETSPSFAHTRSHAIAYIFGQIS